MSASTSKVTEFSSDSKDLEQQTPREEASDQSKNGGEADHIDGRDSEAAGGGEGKGDQQDDGEEEGECGFCLFMKGGGCKDSFIAWEKCVEEADKNEEDVVEKCFEVTSNLKKCMEAHADYYEPILRAEKAAEEEAKDLQPEGEKQSEEQTAISDSTARPEVTEKQVK